MPPSRKTASLFFDEAMLRFLAEGTNAYAEKKLATMTITDRSLYRRWKPVSLKGFIAIILNMGIIQMTNLKDYWSTDETTILPFFHSVMSRDRFPQILGMLHVGDPHDTTRRGKIQPLLDRLCPLFEAMYTPEKQIAIDESVITLKGRVAFRQYLKGKPHPWGIKAFVLSDSNTGYLQRVCVYLRKETQLVDSQHSHTVRVVHTLVEPLHNRGYDFYVDRFYSSPTLATELTKVGITVTGTVQANRKGLPKDITTKRKVPRGTIKAARCNDILVLYWMDKRQVLMLTTKHNTSIVEVRSKYLQYITYTSIWCAKIRKSSYHFCFLC